MKSNGIRFSRFGCRKRKKLSEKLTIVSPIVKVFVANHNLTYPENNLYMKKDIVESVISTI